MNIEGLNRLQVYKSAQELAELVYRHAIPGLPYEEKYGLASQIRRAAASIPANIAEGYGRYYYQESIRFCYLARGSLMELSSHIDLSLSQKYLTEEVKLQLEKKMNEVLKLIHGYIKYLKKSKTGWNEPGAKEIHELNSDYLSDENNGLDR